MIQGTNDLHWARRSWGQIVQGTNGPPPDFSTFNPASESEIHNIHSNCPNKQSDSDLIPIWLLKEYTFVLIPTITNTVNLSLTSSLLHPILKESVISPLLKKSTLDKDQLSNSDGY